MKKKFFGGFFEASLLTASTLEALIDQQGFESITFNHGIYVPHGIVGEIARSKNVRVVNWCPAYRKKCFIFSHKETYHHTLMSESTNHWENLSLTENMEREIMGYLKSRSYGTHDWVPFHQTPEEDLTQIEKEIGIDLSKPTVGLLTNVMWDAQLHYPANVFSNMLEWLLTTVTYFSKRPDLQLLIRVHPGELCGAIRAQQKVADEIKKVFAKLPNNIFIIPPESKISTYTAMQACNAVIIYGTKTGVELTSQGIPVIVAGEAWIRNKGLTIDPHSKKEYFDILETLPLKTKMTPETITRARKYAYHYFFRRMIPLPFSGVNMKSFIYTIGFDSIQELEEGRHLGLDTICDGILKEKNFIFPREEQTLLRDEITDMATAGKTNNENSFLSTK